jgi:uncharacterized protein (DUF433 family)
MFGAVANCAKSVRSGKRGEYSPVGISKLGVDEDMIGSVSQENGRIDRPLYSFAEADRLAKVTPNTSRRWLKGYHFWYSPVERRTMPPITPRSEQIDAVSFVDLMEVAAIGRLRDKGFSLKRIREINEYCRIYLRKQRPLVTETFKVMGRDIFVEASYGVLLNVGYEAGMQAWDEVLDPFLDTVEYENEVVRRWWPLGRDYKVVIDPDYGFGLPVIEGTGVRTEIIAERARAGDSTDEITYDFGVTPDQIEDALRWEMPDAA